MITLEHDKPVRVDRARTGLVELAHMSDEDLERVREELTRMHGMHAPLIDNDRWSTRTTGTEMAS